jgi:hypothetical protein
MKPHEMNRHDMDYGTGYCYIGCEACKKEFWSELKIFAAVAGAALMFFLLVCPCHGSTLALPTSSAVNVSIVAEVDIHLDRHEWPYYPDQAISAQLIKATLIGADPKLVSLEPGDTRVVSKEDLCTAGSTKDARHVTEAMKQTIFKAYGIKSNFGAYEIDHFISLELGGANTIWNLWPQPYEHCRYTARMKDVVETNLHRRICKGLITLKQAQDIIRTDWIAEYKKIKGIK